MASLIQPSRLSHRWEEEQIVLAWLKCAVPGKLCLKLSRNDTCWLIQLLYRGHIPQIGCILASGLAFPLCFFLPGLWSGVVKQLGYSCGLCCLFSSALIFLQFKDQHLLFLKLLPLLLNQMLLEGMEVLRMATISRSCLQIRCLQLLWESGCLIPVHSLVLGTWGCLF